MLPAQDIFLKQLEVRIKKERTVEVTIEEGWYSEQEMVSELHWTKNLGYIYFLCSKYVSLGTIMGSKIDKPSNAQETNPGSNCCMRENAFLCQARFHSPFISQCMLVCNVLVSPSWLSFLKPGKIEIICYQSESSCLCVCVTTVEYLMHFTDFIDQLCWQGQQVRWDPGVLGSAT